MNHALASSFRHLLACALTFAVVSCGTDSPTDPHSELKNGTKLSAQMGISLELSRAGVPTVQQPSPSHFTKEVQIVVRNGRMEMLVPSGNAKGMGFPSVTSYAIDDSTMDQALPASLSYNTAGYAAPDSSGWDDFNYTSPGNVVMSVTEQLGSIGQPTVGTIVVGGVMQYKEIFTWSTVSGGVVLNQAKYEIYDSTNDVLIKMTAIVDSMKVTLLTNRLDRALEGGGAFLASVLPNPAALRNLNPFAVERLWAEVYFSACSEAKTDLFWARVQLAAGSAGFALAPNPATFLAFTYTFGYAGTMRRRMIAACKT